MHIFYENVQMPITPLRVISVFLLIRHSINIFTIYFPFFSTEKGHVMDMGDRVVRFFASGYLGVLNYGFIRNWVVPRSV